MSAKSTERGWTSCVGYCKRIECIYIYIGEIKSKILKDNRGRGMRKYIKGEG